MPNIDAHHVPLSVVDLLCWAGLVGIFVGMGARRMKGVNLVPIKDPRLGDSLAFQNV